MNRDLILRNPGASIDRNSIGHGNHHVHTWYGPPPREFRIFP